MCRLVASLQGDAEALEQLAKDKPFLGVPFSTKEGVKVRVWILLRVVLMQ